MELDLCPHLYSDSWPVVPKPVVLPQLRAQVNEVYHGRIASLPLSQRKVKFLLQHDLNELQYISGGDLGVRL